MRSPSATEVEAFILEPPGGVPAVRSTIAAGDPMPG
jgi:hypothetical protein